MSVNTFQFPGQSVIAVGAASFIGFDMRRLVWPDRCDLWGR